MFNNGKYEKVVQCKHEKVSERGFFLFFGQMKTFSEKSIDNKMFFNFCSKHFFVRLLVCPIIDLDDHHEV